MLMAAEQLCTVNSPASTGDIICKAVKEPGVRPAAHELGAGYSRDATRFHDYVSACLITSAHRHHPRGCDGSKCRSAELQASRLLVLRTSLPPWIPFVENWLRITAMYDLTYVVSR